MDRAEKGDGGPGDEPAEAASGLRRQPRWAKPGLFVKSTFGDPDQIRTMRVGPILRLVSDWPDLASWRLDAEKATPRR